MSVAEVLRAARAKIADPGTWCQGARWRNEDGYGGVNLRDATAFCMVGALDAASKDNAEMFAAWDILEEQVGNEVCIWNDAHGRTHAEVLAVFDRAIAAAERSQA